MKQRITIVCEFCAHEHPDGWGTGDGREVDCRIPSAHAAWVLKAEEEADASGTAVPYLLHLGAHLQERLRELGLEVQRRDEVIRAGATPREAELAAELHSAREEIAELNAALRREHSARVSETQRARRAIAAAKAFTDSEPAIHADAVLGAVVRRALNAASVPGAELLEEWRPRVRVSERHSGRAELVEAPPPKESEHE